MTETNQQANGSSPTLQFATDIVTAYVSNNPVPPSDLPTVIRAIHDTLNSLAEADVPEEQEVAKPAVPIKKSITDEYLICLEDGKKLKMLKRYLRSRYDMSPEDYRSRWNLPSDYPMVAPNYAARRSEFAKQIGLGKGGRGRRAKG